MEKKLSNNNLFISKLIKAKVFLGLNSLTLNPSINTFLLGIKNNFCIFNLKYTKYCLIKAFKIILKINQKKGKILLVGFPESQIEKIINFCLRSKQQYFYFSDESWVLGVLTNRKILFKYKTKFLVNLKKKNEIQKKKFFERFNSILKFDKQPNLIIVFNYTKNINILKEAHKIGIPTISIINSQDNLQFVDYPIPGNFNSKKAGILYYNLIKLALTKNKKRKSWI